MIQDAQRRATVQSRLQQLGIATPEQIEQASQEQGKTQERFATVLARLGLIRNADIGWRLGPQLGWIPQPLEASQVDPGVSQRIAAELCQAHRVVPIREASGGGLVLATDDPFTIFSMEWLQQQCGVDLEVVLIREQDLDSLLTQRDQAPQAEPPPPKASPSPPKAPAAAVATSAPPKKPKAPPPRPPEATRKPTSPAPAAASAKSRGGVELPIPGQEVTASDEPVIRLVDSLLMEAGRMRASDVHVEVQADLLKVRYRIDGVLRDVNTPPKALQGPITSRIKIMASLNIAEKRLPQDGRLETTISGRSVDVRVSTLPALHGESIVMRLLDRAQSVQNLEDLGLAQDDVDWWNKLIARPYGMVLVTGPTGSGKTTTLYATLAALNRPDRKLITVEDPVEYRLSGINQVNVKASIGLTFAAGLRAMLRQAPDVIMVGEIRDQETAQIAVQAALTGHLIFSTLHTNDAASAVTRLMDMGVAPFLVASTVQGVMAQRLIRQLCSSCSVKRPPTPEERAFLGEPPVSEVAEGKGCERCSDSGYFGRMGIYELMVLTDPLRELVATRCAASVLRELAVKEGMHVLRDDGCRKIREGLTSMTEVLRATPEGG